MSLYTLVFDFDGGTYICQAQTENRLNAPYECVKAWDVSDINDVIRESDKSEMLKQIKDENFVPLIGLKNAWCGCVFIRGSSATLNLIKTESET